MSRKKNPNTEVTLRDLCNRRIKALKALSPAISIVIAGKTFTVAQAVAFYQQVLDDLDAITNVRAQETKALDESRVSKKACRDFDKGLKSWAHTQFAANDPAANGFDILPKAPTVPTVDEKALAVAKRDATRKARGTMGSREKSKIHGTIPVPSEQAAPAANPTVHAPAGAVTTVTVTTPSGAPAGEASPVNGAAHS
jgi:hypothetical protein